MTRLLIVHHDPGVRAHLADGAVAGSGFELEVDQAETLDAATALTRPDVMIVPLPDAPRGADPASRRFPDALASTPSIIILDQPDGEDARDALALKPAAVLLTDPPPDLLGTVIWGALNARGVVLDKSISEALVALARERLG